MAGTLKTTNYQLAKYAPNDITSWLTDFNGNMDLIDAGMQANKQAATQAQDGVDALEAEYKSLLTIVNGNTSSINANEKAIAANAASIEEMESEIDNISIGDLALRYVEGGIKVEPLISSFTLTFRKIGNYAAGSAICVINTGTAHTYDRVGTGLLDNLYITDLVRYNGNPFNLVPNVWTPIPGINVSGDVAPGAMLLGIAYISESNFTVIGWTRSDESQIKFTGNTTCLMSI